MGSGDSKARIAEAEHNSAARQHEATQATLRRQYEANQKIQIVQAELAHQKQVQVRQATLERERRAHEARLKELENAQVEKNKQLKLQQKQSGIAECDKMIGQCKQSITEATTKLKDASKKCTKKEEDIANLSQKIDKFATYRSSELEKKSIDIGLAKATQEFDSCNDEINAAIDATSVQEDNIGRFLLLVSGLRTATLANQEQANRLNAEINTFGDLISRSGSGKLSIEHYFTDAGMERFVPMLAVEDLSEMGHLICRGDDKDEKKESFDEILDVLVEGMALEHANWEKDKNDNEFEPKVKLSLREKRFLNDSCLKPDTWQDDENDKIEVTKESLNELSPLLSNFFNRIHISMKQAQLILSYNSHLSEDQQKAIQMASKLPIKSSKDINDSERLKSGSMLNDDVDDTDTFDNDEKKDSVVSTIDSNIDAIQVNDDDATLAVIDGIQGDSQRKLFTQNMALNKAAILSINVIDSMGDAFEGSPNKLRALGLAQSIEGTCMEIVRCNGTIRQSLLLGESILSLKPSNMSATAKLLWDSVDSGIIQIYSNALEMSKVSANYFGYFLKFKQSFAYYLSANDKSLLVSTEHLQNDIRAFNKFSNKFEKSVSQLSRSAMTCIENCVKTTKGAENFEKARIDRKNKEEKYLATKKVYDARCLELDADYGTWLNERATMKAKVAYFKCLIDSLNRQITYDSQLLNNTEKTKDFLVNMVV